MSQGPIYVTSNVVPTQTALGVSAETQIKATNGFLCSVNVTTAGAAGAIYDSATISGVGASNLIGVIPATVGIYTFNIPFKNGLVYNPGAAQVATIAYR